LGEVVGAVHAILLAAVAVALSGQQVAAAPPRQRHEPFVLKQLLLCHIHTAAALALQQDRIYWVLCHLANRLNTDIDCHIHSYNNIVAEAEQSG